MCLISSQHERKMLGVINLDALWRFYAICLTGFIILANADDVTHSEQWRESGLSDNETTTSSRPIMAVSAPSSSTSGKEEQLKDITTPATVKKPFESTMPARASVAKGASSHSSASDVAVTTVNNTAAADKGSAILQVIGLNNISNASSQTENQTLLAHLVTELSSSGAQYQDENHTSIRPEQYTTVTNRNMSIDHYNNSLEINTTDALVVQYSDNSKTFDEKALTQVIPEKGSDDSSITPGRTGPTHEENTLRWRLTTEGHLDTITTDDVTTGVDATNATSNGSTSFLHERSTESLNTTHNGGTESTMISDVTAEENLQGNDSNYFLQDNTGEASDEDSAESDEWYYEDDEDDTNDYKDKVRMNLQNQPPTDDVDWSDEDDYTDYNNDDEIYDNDNTYVNDQYMAKNTNTADGGESSEELFLNAHGFGGNAVSGSIEGTHYRVNHSVWEDNSMGLLVFYTWIAVVTFMVIVVLIGYKYRQKFSNIFWETRTGYRRDRRVAVEEGHTLLTHPHV